MTDTTFKNAMFGVNPALSAAANKQKSAQNAAKNAQDFGAVLDKTTQKIEKTDQTKQSATDNTKNQTKQSEKTASAAREKETSQNTASVKETASETKETASTENANQVTDEMEESIDKLTTDEIAKALQQIIAQLQELLGITDDELLGGMEELGLQPFDLLNVNNMAQLVASVSGEESTIGLVANEELYATLQNITEMLETQVNNLLENTGLTSEELEAVLQKLQELESQNLDSQLQNEMCSEEAVESLEGLMTEEKTQQQASEGPIIIREDNTTSEDQSTKQNDQLSENQQEDLAKIDTKPQTQDTGRESKNSESDKDARNFGQNNTTQNFQNQLNGLSDSAAAEGVAKFTSESTESIMRQLADMVKIIKNENLTEMELQLHPASLGTVNVSLTTKGGMVTAEFTTQNEAVKAAIEAQASQLRANLEEQGVKIEAIEVSVESHQMERDLDKNGQEQQRQAQEQETERIQGMRRNRSNINLRAFMNGEELEGEMQGADDATRIAMEIMAANGNTMDLLV
ncbi:hypothetical protein IMSAGC011_00685 [Lachnospiraceae bacterium]|nr:hypothetical protein IMSAGC011_00685 [Lachnospiraceae bacterium]